MVKVRSLDAFIEQSSLLLEARPDTTRVTTTYTHQKAPEGPTVLADARPALAYVKAYDPVSGACYRVRVAKTNELSRIMSALGPRGVSITKKPKRAVDEAVQENKIRGLASIMAGVDVEYTDEPEARPADTPEPVAAGESKKKKKGKKK